MSEEGFCSLHKGRRVVKQIEYEICLDNASYRLQRKADKLWDELDGMESNSEEYEFTYKRWLKILDKANHLYDDVINLEQIRGYYR